MLFFGPTWRFVAKLVHESLSINLNVLMAEMGMISFLSLSQLINSISFVYVEPICLFLSVFSSLFLHIFWSWWSEKPRYCPQKQNDDYMCPAHVRCFNGSMTFILRRFRQCCVCVVFFEFSVSETCEHFDAASMRLNVFTVQLNSLKSHCKKKGFFSQWLKIHLCSLFWRNFNQHII